MIVPSPNWLASIAAEPSSNSATTFVPSTVHEEENWREGNLFVFHHALSDRVFDNDFCVRFFR
jgi:hypothetical protein